MVLELHIWGPAFSLASIDAQCLASIAYLQFSLSDEKSWVIVPDAEAGDNPVQELPALRDGDLWIGGFKAITSYLRDVSKGEWDLDRDLSQRQRADCVALSTFIFSRGQPLLDLNLYVSSENYNSATKPALAEILAWPGSWTVPHRLRDKAKRRSAHLGLDALDVDTATEDSREGDGAGIAGQIPKSLRKPKQTVSGLLGRNAQSASFRLDAVTSEFLDPLEDMLGMKEWFLGDECTSVDCLALGYLALMQRPQMAHTWLKETLKKKYPKLDRWTRNLERHVLEYRRKDQKEQNNEPEASTALSTRFRKPSARSWIDVGQAVLDICLLSLPVVGSRFLITEVRTDKIAEKDKYRKNQLALECLRNQQIVYSRIMAAGAGIFIVFGTMLWNGWSPFPRRLGRSNPRRFGEAGAMLGLG